MIHSGSGPCVRGDRPGPAKAGTTTIRLVNISVISDRAVRCKKRVFIKILRKIKDEG
jgi:hypothetical protein